VLAVGDEGFTHKCLDKFAEFRRIGKTILLVTHSLGLVERFCDDAIWLDNGQVRSLGDPKRVVDAYLASVEKSEDALLATTTAKAVAAVTPAPAAPVPALPDHGELKNLFQAVEGRWGSRQIEITGVTLAGRDGESFIFHTGEPMRVTMKIVAHAPATDFVFGVSFFNADGVCCYGTNTYIEQMDPLRLEGAVEVVFEIDSLDLVEGTYKLDVAVHTCDGYPYDYHRLLYTFRMKSRTPDVGIYRPRHHWSFSRGIAFKEMP
jgi:hypothetical protein